MFYALQTRGGQEGSPDVVTGMFKVFQFNVYALLNPGDTLSFEIPYVAMKFDVLPDIRSFFLSLLLLVILLWLTGSIESIPLESLMFIL